MKPTRARATVAGSTDVSRVYTAQIAMPQMPSASSVDADEPVEGVGARDHAVGDQDCGDEQQCPRDRQCHGHVSSSVPLRQGLACHSDSRSNVRMRRRSMRRAER